MHTFTMKIRRTIALAAAMTFAVSLPGLPAGRAGAQATGTISGTAKKEAKRPYPDYSVRARDVEQGLVAATLPLDESGNFALAGIATATYLVELLDAKGKVVCTEGPFDLSTEPFRRNVNIECGKPAAWWLLAAAAAAGITAGVVTTDAASASR
jgi:hypothetical protein